MSPRPAAIAAFVLLAGCPSVLPGPVPAACDPRLVYYPDADGDGVGEPTDIYIGCDPPADWVTTVDTGAPTTTPTTPTTPTETGGTGATSTPTGTP